MDASNYFAVSGQVPELDCDTHIVDETYLVSATHFLSICRSLMFPLIYLGSFYSFYQNTTYCLFPLSS